MAAPRHAIVEEDLDRILSSPLPWGEFDGASVAVTGAGGFLPAYMVETLLYRNEGLAPARRTRVTALVRSPAKAQKRFAHYAGRPDLELVPMDLALPNDWPGTPDYLISAASPASPRTYGSDPVGVLAPNILGTRWVLEKARLVQSRGVLFFSSGEVYGGLPADQWPAPEDRFGPLDPADARSCYAESKRMGETMCVAWHRQYGVPAKIVRPFHTYGPGLDLDDGRVFADFVSDAVHGRDIVMKGDGTALRAFCYLADACAGFFTVLLKGEAGRAYNVGNDRGELSILALAELVVSLVPGKHLKVVRAQRDAGGGYLASPLSRNCPDIKRIGALGWRPSTPPEEGFHRTIRSFQ